LGVYGDHGLPFPNVKNYGVPDLDGGLEGGHDAFANGKKSWRARGMTMAIRVLLANAEHQRCSEVSRVSRQSTAFIRNKLAVTVVS
jgi:hypothetical protein